MSMSTTNQEDAIARPQPYFATTRWTMVMAAGHSDTPSAHMALEELCRAYWYPLYVYARRRGHNAEDSEDLTQEFFRRFLAGHSLETADPNKGRFRSFLLTVFKRFLANEWDRACAQKRGGGVPALSVDTKAAETRYLVEPSVECAPERIYDRRWAMALLGRSVDRVRDEYVQSGKGAEFDQIKSCLTAERGTINYAEMAQASGTSEGALRVAIHRLRRRFREVFRDEIAQTVAHSDEIDDEVRYLMSVLAD